VPGPKHKKVVWPVETRHASAVIQSERLEGAVGESGGTGCDGTEHGNSRTHDWHGPLGAGSARSATLADNRHATASVEPSPTPGRLLTERLTRIIGQVSFDRHFRGRVEIRLKDGGVEVYAPSRAAADVLRRRFGVALRQAGADDLGALGRAPEVVFITPPEAAAPDATAQPEGPAQHVPSRSVATAAEHLRPHPHRSPASSTRYRLEDYIVGESNQVAYNAAAQLAAGDDGGAARTLFVHGPCGLGKTHLLQGAAQRFRERLPGAVVRVTSGESFMNDFVASIRAAGAEGSAGQGGVAKFRRAYRRADLLCIDDVHFLASKQATQDELLHTFDEIERGGARVLLVSDLHPRALRKFSPALVSRFMSGMVASIAPPENALRERITRAFAIRRGLSLDESGIRAVATRAAWTPGATTGPSIRDIEGMLTKIDALRRVAPEYLGPAGTIGAGAIERALGGPAGGSAGTISNQSSGGGALVHVQRPARPVRVHVIIAQTCAALAVEVGELSGKTRHKRVVLARALVTYISRALTTQSFPDIARALGRPSHSTVITAYQRFCRQLAVDEAVTLEHASEPTTMTVLTRQLIEAVVHASAKG